ncbi:hypothetical protein V6N13_057288 [Hibiscus sabdariffa]|uniref:Uncharacterized protein n=2 Tax=Hibiscus sabdariffa TaxID=183260 RepID=A0ABR2CV56_9ROSI
MEIPAASMVCGSGLCESRVWHPFGRRLVRLEGSSPDLRHRVAVPVRLWNEAHCCDGNGGCTVSTPFFFSFLQVLARRVAWVDRFLVFGKGQIWYGLVGHGLVIGGGWKCWYEDDGFGLLAIAFCWFCKEIWLQGIGKLSVWMVVWDKGGSPELVQEVLKRQWLFRRGEEAGKGFKFKGFGNGDLGKGWSLMDAQSEWQKSIGKYGESTRVSGFRERMKIARLKTITWLNQEITWVGEGGDGTCERRLRTGERRGEHSLTSMTGSSDGLFVQVELVGLSPQINMEGPGIVVKQMITSRIKGFSTGLQGWVTSVLFKETMGSEFGISPKTLKRISNNGLIITTHRGPGFLGGDKRYGYNSQRPHMLTRFKHKRGFVWEFKRLLRYKSRKRKVEAGGPDSGEIVTVRWVWFWIEGWGVTQRKQKVRVEKCLMSGKVSLIWERKKKAGNLSVWFNCKMADEMTKQMESLKFLEEELADVGGDILGSSERLEGSKTWLVGKLVSPEMVDTGLLIRVF